MVDQGYLVDFYKVFKAWHGTNKHTYQKELICKYLNNLVQENTIKSFCIDEGKSYDIFTITVKNTQYYDEEQLLRLFDRIEFISER